MMMKQKCKTFLHGKQSEEKMKDFYEFCEQKKIPSFTLYNISNDFRPWSFRTDNFWHYRQKIL